MSKRERVKKRIRECIRATLARAYLINGKIRNQENSKVKLIKNSCFFNEKMV